jgi:YHS domain-containing protein
MLRRELIIGYLVAGILAVAVPTSVYGLLFLQGHGVWTELENVVIGPFIAFISFVCSVGNVPLAAALFTGGFSLGGTVAFLFADLIALPLVIIYARFYGRRLALRLFLGFWAVMSAAGLLVDVLFRVIRLPMPRRPVVIAPMRFEWNYTTWLDLAFIVIGVVIYVVHRNRDRLAPTSHYATDHVCGMQVEKANAPATANVRGSTYYFCCDPCRDTFIANPDRYLGSVQGQDSASGATLG